MISTTRKFLVLAFCLVAVFMPAALKARPQITNTETSQTPKTIFPVTGAPATFPNVVLAAIKAGGLDMTSDQAIDDFAKVEYCDIYQKYSANEFDWRRVRLAMRKKIDLDKPNYPSTLYLERSETVGKYDFSTGMLPLLPDSIIHTRALQLANSGGNFCGARLTSFPAQFVALLKDPLNLDGIDLTEDEARTVVAGLAYNATTPDQRIAYGRYTVTFTGPDAVQTAGVVRLDATLDNITLYQDSDYARPFWSGLSSEIVHRKESGELDAIPFKGIDPTVGQTPDPGKPVPSVTPPAAPK